MQLHKLRSWLRRKILAESPAEEAWRYRKYPAAGGVQFINVGAGRFYHPRWTNIDYGSDWYRKHQRKQAFIDHNLMTLDDLPLETGKVELAYTSHTIEHVTDAAAAKMFAEVHRVLRPGGIFRITCPDAALLLRSVQLGRPEFWRWRHPWFRQRNIDPDTVPIEDFFIREVATERSRFTPPEDAPKLSADEVRAHVERDDRDGVLSWVTEACRFRPDYPGYHINWWTHDKCTRLLQAAGFNTIYHSTRGGSLAAPLQNGALFDSTQPSMSLYLEAVK